MSAHVYFTFGFTYLSPLLSALTLSRTGIPYFLCRTPRFLPLRLLPPSYSFRLLLLTLSTHPQLAVLTHTTHSVYEPQVPEFEEPTPPPAGLHRGGRISVGWSQRDLPNCVGVTSRCLQVGVFGPGNMPALASSVGYGLWPGDPRDHQLAIQDAHWLGSANDGFGAHHPLKPRSSVGLSGCSEPQNKIKINK